MEKHGSESYYVVGEGLLDEADGGRTVAKLEVEDTAPPFRFSRMGPRGVNLQPGEGIRKKVGNEMAAGGGRVSSIPAGFTYLGQFVDHDLTFDKTTVMLGTLAGWRVRDPDKAPRRSAMYREIIVGYDGRERGQDALALGELLAEAGAAQLVVAGVFQFDPRWRDQSTRMREAEAEYARAIEAVAASVGAEPEAVPNSSVGRGMHELAEEIGADLIVVGSSHRSRAGQVLAGNVGQLLMHASPCSVAVAPHGFADSERRELEEIVVGYDGTDEARMALNDATDLARASGALLKLVTVSEPPPTSYGRAGGRTAGWHALKESIDASMRECLDEGMASLPEDLPAEGVLAHGEPADLLAEIATAEGALLVLGSRAYGPAQAGAPGHRREQARPHRALPGRRTPASREGERPGRGDDRDG